MHQEAGMTLVLLVTFMRSFGQPHLMATIWLLTQHFLVGLIRLVVELRLPSKKDNVFQLISQNDNNSLLLTVNCSHFGNLQNGECVQFKGHLDVFAYLLTSIMMTSEVIY